MKLDRGSRFAAGVVWALAAAVIAFSVVWGRRYQHDSPEIFLGAAPLVGRNYRDGWDWRFGWSLVPAAAIAIALALAVWRGWWWRLRARTVIALTSIGSATFGTLLALTDGRDGLTYGAAHSTEYLANLSIAPPPREFLRTFVERIDDYTVHQRGHPPGFVLVLEWLDAVGLSGVWPVVALTIIATAVLPAAVLVAVWATAGPDRGGDWVRRTAPALLVPPYLIWMVTSGDAVFTACAATGIAFLAVALRRTDATAIWLGGLGGSALGALLFLTYGGASFALVPLVVVIDAWWRPGGPAGAQLARVIGSASASVVAITTAFLLAGFWWLDGARATGREYWDGTAQFRSFRYFSIANLAVALIAIGPLTVAGLLRLRSRPVWVLVGGASLALLASHASQYTRGEVERIWLLFFPLIVIAGGAVLCRERRATAAIWIAVQAGCAITLQAALVTKW